MATSDRPAVTPQHGQRPTSVQPGGGFVLGLELAWGRLRRARLRTFRPGYVRKMLALRQGDCSDCPHDVIDPRDLKFSRNVCGYWFRPEDDRFAWRGRLGFARAGLAELLLFTLLFFAVAGATAAAALLLHPLCWLALIPAVLLWAEVLWFFRDPERHTPDDPSALVSPADGTVTHVGEVEDPDFPGGRAFRVSIFLSIFNVHVNRAPRAARVVGLRYFPGAFLDARHPECGRRNEQLWVDFDDPVTGRRLRVKQISGKIARRIVCWLRDGEQVKAGERFGMIKFGSRTEVYLPADSGLECLVKVGDKVRGGLTVLGRFR